MLVVNKDQLTCIEGNFSKISVASILGLIMEGKCHEDIFLTIHKKLYGQISLRNPNYTEDQKHLIVDKDVKSICGWKYKDARDLFLLGKVKNVPVIDSDGILMGAYIDGNSTTNINQRRSILKWIRETQYIDKKTLILLPTDSDKESIKPFASELEKYVPLTISTWKELIVSGDWARKYDLILCLNEELRICAKFLFGKLGIGLKNNWLTCTEFLNEFVIPPELARGFLQELYSPKYWAEFKSRSHPQYKMNGITWLKTQKSKYVNISDGHRVELFYDVTRARGGGHKIWLFGRCVFVGSRVEDKNTMSSVLQLECNQNGHGDCRVMNRAAWEDETGRIWKMVNTEFSQGDILIMHETGDMPRAQKINPAKIAYEHSMPFDWFTDQMPHANHHATKIWGQSIYKVIEKYLDETPTDKKFIPRKNYIENYYLDTYFSDFDFSNKSRIGSIVMNCNPFTKGHRYLIEQARKSVDVLIIFVVEEDKSYFDFTDRFAMVCAGVEDLDGVIVVPSGDFILSASTFPEYFMKIEDKDIQQNVEFDVSLFGECIANPLKINYRFVGEELSDPVTEKYNRAMEKILPSYGVEVVEIPRIKTQSDVISASLVRKYLDSGEFSKLSDLLPDTTLRYLESIYKKSSEIEESYRKISLN